MIHEIRTYNLKLGQLQEYWKRFGEKLPGSSRALETRWALVHGSRSVESDDRHLALRKPRTASRNPTCCGSRTESSMATRYK